jgi:hypothetical protein
VAWSGSRPISGSLPMALGRKPAQRQMIGRRGELHKVYFLF